ncbi:MAG: glycosyltransferase family 39 protein [Acidobacteria bacterium]|nr:glycosyltransferase family 39 protein [Acidobacteriota bacterium]
MKRGAGLLVTGAFFGVSALFVAVAAHDQATGREIWAPAASLMGGLTAGGTVIASHLGWLTVGIAAVLTALIGWAALGRAAGRYPPTRWLLSALAVGTWAQAALVLKDPKVGGTIWLLAGALAVWGLVRASRHATAVWKSAGVRPTPWARTDILLLLLLMLVAALFRFYELGRIMNYFEGELAPYYVGATSLHGMWLADAGKNGPWAPLHLAFYLPVWLTTHLLGSTVLAIRVAAALVSLTSVPLLYAVARRAGGRPAALLATSFLVLDPLQIGWGRSDVHPHASTLWAPLLVCLTLFRAVERRRPVDFALLALAMGVTWQTYPSGQSAVLIPVVVFGGAYLCRSARIRRLGVKPPLAVASGLLLWAASIPLPWLIALHRWRVPNLLHEFGNRTSWDAAPATTIWDTLLRVAHLSCHNVIELLEGLFYRVPNLFHQTFLPTAPHYLERSLNWAALPFALLGIGLALVVPTLRHARVIAAWAFVAALPSILSAEGYVKRAATLYPALLVLAGVGFSVLWRWSTPRRKFLRLVVCAFAVAAFACLAAFQSYLWFSGANYRAGTPGIEVSMRSLRPYLEPGTIAVLDPSHPYLSGMTTYLLLDTLAEKDRFPVAWIPGDNGIAPFARLLDNPAVGLASLPYTPWYTWSKLRPLIRPLMSVKDWKRVVFLFQTVVHGKEQPKTIADLQEALRRYPEARVTKLAGPNPDYRLTVVVVDLATLTAGTVPAP